MIKPLRELAAALPNKKLYIIHWRSRNGHEYYKVKDENNNVVKVIKKSVGDKAHYTYIDRSGNVNVSLLKSDLLAHKEAERMRAERKANKKPRQKRVVNGPF